MVAACVCAAILFCLVFMGEHKESGNPISSYEKYTGRIYDEDRLVTEDILALQDRWAGKTVRDTVSRSRQAGWRYMPWLGNGGWRYYTTGEEYVVGWQYLERAGVYDWYYFDTKTGVALKDTILDGVVLSKKGYAVAVSANTATAIQSVDASGHCKEILLTGEIPVEEKLVLHKSVTLVSKMGETAVLKDTSQQSSAAAPLQAVLSVCEQAEVILASGVDICVDERSNRGIQIEDQAAVTVYGTVECEAQTAVLEGGTEALCGIAVLNPKASVFLCSSACVSGFQTGIYSEGRIVLQEENVDTFQCAGLGMQRVHAASVGSGKMISGNSNHGITQSGGTLTMSGGNIFNNGTLGSDSNTGSNGGGVYLTNGAVMNMSGGTISGNRASYGAGVYVSEGCTLNMTGGTIGGTKLYASKAENTTANGNYAREHKKSNGGTKYARGSGGGIYSAGTVNINGKNTVNISYNVCKGPGGGGGILLYSGTAIITGNVNVNNNRTWNSDGKTSADVASGDPNGEGAGIRVGYDNTKNGTICRINCTNESGYPVTSGTVNVKGNVASGDGGGIYISEGTNISLVIKGKTYIQNNVSQDSGGGGVKTLGGALSIHNAVISGNTAKVGRGGGVYSAGKTYITGCKIYGNTAEKEGGGVAFYKSSVGTIGTGTLHGCEIYKNTSQSGGAGVEVRDNADMLIRGGTKIYENCSACPGVRCTQKGVLTLEGCYIYGNGTYGLYNQGVTSGNGQSYIGYAAYSSDAVYTGKANGGGGVYNSGQMTINARKELKIYGGSRTAFYNAGTVLFEDLSSNSFFSANASEVIKNTGTFTAIGANQNGGPIMFVGGDEVQTGIDNDKGVLSWNGYVTGRYDVTAQGAASSDGLGRMTVGIRNRNGGTLTSYAASQSNACKIGIYNQSGSKAYISGMYKDNVESGIQNDGEMQLCTKGEMLVKTVEAVGIFNKGILHGELETEANCVIRGTGTGIKNAGTCYLDKLMQIGAESTEARTGILNMKAGVVYLTGGTYRNSTEYGIYCQKESRLYMGKAACVDVGNRVFLEEGCYVDVNAPLTTAGTVAVLDTKKDQDRKPGRVVVKVSYTGGTGKRELYDREGKQRFVLNYEKTDEDTPAFLFDGSRIHTVEDVAVTAQDMYLSTCYPIQFDSGYWQIAGAIEADVAMKQTDCEKYWMEDLLLDLEGPVLLRKKLLNAGWSFQYWEGDNRTIYSRTSELFTENRALKLTAQWRKDRENGLDAWLYDRSLWLRNQMQGSKMDEQYKYFLAGDTGVITFTSVNMEEVSIIWPATGGADELKTYDRTGTDVENCTYLVSELTDSLSSPYENSSYQFRVPLGTPAGPYKVTVVGVDDAGQTWTCVLSVVVGGNNITSTIRTRIR